MRSDNPFINKNQKWVKTMTGNMLSVVGGRLGNYQLYLFANLKLEIDYVEWNDASTTTDTKFLIPVTTFLLRFRRRRCTYSAIDMSQNDNASSTKEFSIGNSFNVTTSAKKQETIFSLQFKCIRPSTMWHLWQRCGALNLDSSSTLLIMIIRT